ncbi:MAG: hypothetical protein ABIK93_01510 [candidate division WOR-3 bacterium]
MKRIKWQILLGLFLVVLAAMIYLLHYAIFHDPHHIFIYLLGDIAFLPIQVLLVTLIIDELLSKREKSSVLKKLNMVIGAFFSEVGMKLLKSFANFDQDSERIRQELIVKDDWSEKKFLDVTKKLKHYECKIDSKRGDLAELKQLLISKRNFLLRLLENPNLLEHETFTELLRAVFHLTEELENRHDVKNLSRADYDHLGNDIRRAHRLLLAEWVDYMRYLKLNYPYLFSLAMRINPFDPNATVEIKE